MEKVKVPNLSPVLIKVDDMNVYQRNAKKHPEEQVDLIVKSIEKFGFRNPILLNNEVDKSVVAGHGRILAAKRLGIDELPVVYLNDLSKEDIKAFRLMDNRSAESDWDYDLIKSELDVLSTEDYDLSFTGFSLDEVSDLVPNEDSEVVEDVVEVDAYERAKNKTTIKNGDIYELGNHKLMCGNSTEETDVNKLMNGKNADMVLTDPPYNVNIGWDKKNTKFRKISHQMINDDLSKENFSEFLKKTITSIMSVCNGAYYIFMSCKEWGSIMQEFEQQGGHWSSTIIWNKSSFVISRKDYHPKFEPILYGWKEKTKINHLKDRTQSDVWDFDKPNNSKEHPTMKPIALCAKAITNSSKPENIVLDLFGGSGSTLIACEQLNRKCYMMELDPVYCQIIINRWEKLTGLKAKKIMC